MLIINKSGIFSFNSYIELTLLERMPYSMQRYNSFVKYKETTDEISHYSVKA